MRRRSFVAALAASPVAAVTNTMSAEPALALQCVDRVRLRDPDGAYLITSTNENAAQIVCKGVFNGLEPWIGMMRGYRFKEISFLPLGFEPGDDVAAHGRFVSIIFDRLPT